MTFPPSNLEPVAQQNALDFIEMRGISKLFGGVRAENYSVMAIMAAGLLVALISGGIDISFAAIAATAFAAKRQRDKWMARLWLKRT